MATAAFFRDAPPDNDLRQDGADFRLGFERFQMVPVRGSRPGQISTLGLVRIKSGDESIVKISAGRNVPPSRVIEFNQPPPLGDVPLSSNFVLFGGQKAGKTFIVAEDERGKPLHEMTVSVKDNITVRYHLLRLKDGLREAQMKMADAEPILKNVEQLYFNQANVQLVKDKSADLFVQRNLSDSGGVLQLDEIFDNKEQIIFEETKKQGFGGVAVVFVITWELAGSNLPLSTTGLKLLGRCERAKIRSGPTMIYINSIGKGGPSHSFTAAHELGHHFGMSHTGLTNPRPPTFLMDAAGTVGFKMTQDDINLANRTGT